MAVLKKFQAEEEIISKQCSELNEAIISCSNKKEAAEMFPDLYSFRGRFDGVKRAENILLEVMIDTLEPQADQANKGG